MIFDRRCASHLIRLSGLCDSRNAADLRSSAMVLGSRARQKPGHGLCGRELEFVPQDHCTSRHRCRIFDVDYRRGIVYGFTHVLSPSAW